MTNGSATRNKYTVEGHLDGAWDPVETCNDREAAILAAGSVAASGAFDFVRLTRHDEAAEEGWRELVRIDRNGTIRNGAFVAPEPELPRRPQPLTAANLPPEPLERRAPRRRQPRHAMAIAVVVVLLVVGIAVGNWAIGII